MTTEITLGEQVTIPPTIEVRFAGNFLTLPRNTPVRLVASLRDVLYMIDAFARGLVVYRTGEDTYVDQNGQPVTHTPGTPPVGRMVVSHNK